jgi:PAS domain S-box-containing protein
LSKAKAKPGPIRSQAAPSPRRPQPVVRRRTARDPLGSRLSKRFSEAEASLQALINVFGDPTVLLDRTGKIILPSESFARYLGKDVRDVIGLNLQSLLSPYEAKLAETKVQEIIRTGKPQVVETTRDGRTFQTNLLPLHGLSGHVERIAVIQRNITPLKKAQAQAEETEKRYEAIVESSSDGVLTIENGIITFINRRVTELSGYRVEELIGKPFERFIDPKELPRIMASIRQRAADPSHRSNYETVLKTKTGTEVHVEITASSLPSTPGANATLAILRDITERKKVARDLIEFHTQLTTLLQAIPDIVYFKDDQGRNLVINKAFEKMVGLPADKIQGRTDFEIFPPELAEECRQSDMAVRRARTTIRLEESVSAGTKSETRYETLKAPILDATGNFVGLVGVSRDVTEQKHNEKIRSSILSIAQAALSSESIDTFLGSVHDIIAELMPAKNFYVAVYDETSGLLSFPYFVDEFDSAPEPRPLRKGLTEYVLRTAQPLLATPEVFAALEAGGEVESIGAPSIDWLGVPLAIGKRTFGVLVVQSYTPGIRYREVEKEILRFVSGQVAMSLRRRRQDEESREREQFLSGVLNSIQDGISILDTDYTIVRVNRTMEQWYAHAAPLPGKKCYEAYHLRAEPCAICPTRTTLSGKQAAHEVVPLVGPGGSVSGWLDLFSYPFIDQQTGQMKGVIEYVRDITDRKQAEDKLQSSLLEKEVLLREIHHRVKNNLQVIQSLISLQSRQIKDGQALEMYKESQRRIHSMALIHERLYQSANLSRIEFAEYLRSLVVHLFHSLVPSTGRLDMKMDLEPVELNVNIAIPCGLIVSELVSNALKHAFPGERSGRVTVSLHRGDNSTVRLGVKDDGIGLPEDFDARLGESLGMQIVMTLVSQIEGHLRIGRAGGAEFQVEFRESGQMIGT